MTTIVALGDSTTAGAPGFRSPLEAPPDGDGNVESQYAYWLMRRRPDWRVLNRGVNGERTDQIRARFARDVGGADPDLVVILAGVNDIYQGLSPDIVQRELAAMYEMAHHLPRPIPLVAATILPFDTASSEQNARMEAVNAWIRERAAGDPRLTFCDTRRAVSDELRPDRLISSPDGLHPSPEGYKRMALALEPAIAQALPAPPR